jgi:hypothetical protein
MFEKQRISRNAVFVAAIFSGAVACPGEALAQANDATWLIRAAAFFPNVDTHVRADGSNGQVGTSIDFETDLGLEDSKTLPVLELEWRMAANHRLDLGYLNLSRSATSVLKGSISWQGQVYPINTTVTGEFDSRILALTYLYSFYHTPATEIAAGLGIHNANLKSSISAAGAAVAGSREVSANAPLPVIALRANQRFTDAVSGELRYQWFGLKYGDYDGSLHVVNATVAYYPWKNWGFEAGYAYNRYDIKVQKDTWRGEAQYKFSGPTLAFVAAF